MYVDPIEGIWLGLNILTAIMATIALRRALGRRRIAQRSAEDDHAAREIVAGGSVRHQVNRLLSAVMFIIVVIPGLFQDRPIPFSLLLLALLIVPAGNLVDVLVDLVDWRRIDALP